MQHFFDFPVTPHYSFDSYVSCDGNAAALRFARRIADCDDSENLLYLHGPPGSGKTHLVRAIAGALGEGRELPVLSCAEPLMPGDIACRFSTAQALLVDDIHLLPDDPVLRVELWQVFNDLHTAGSKIAVTGLHPPRELYNLDEHLISRLLWGLVARLDVSDDSSRRMILRKLAHDRQVLVPDDVFEYLVSTSSREVGALIAAFDAIYRLSMAEKRRITVSLARDSLGRRREPEAVATRGASE